MEKNVTEPTEKKAYQAPKLVVHGDVEVITQGFKTGTKLDATFPVGTPFSDLKFS
jgi:hypothetical protein